MKRIFSIVLVIALALCLGVVAFASEEEEETSLSYGSELWAAMREEYGYSIYVEDTAEGANYNVYKIFDITGEDDEVACTISQDSPWYDMVANGYTVFDEIDSMGFSGTPFILSDGSDGNDIVDVYGSTMDILAYFPNAEIPADAEPISTEVGTGGEMTVQVAEDGVYYITDADGVPVMLAVIVPVELVSDLVTSLMTESLVSDFSDEFTSGEMDSALEDIFGDDVDASDIVDTNILDDVLSASDEMDSLDFSRVVYQDVLTLYTVLQLPSGEDFQLVIQAVGEEVNSIAAINPRTIALL